MGPINSSTPEALDEAVSRRLARFAERSMDVTGLARRLDLQINAARDTEVLKQSQDRWRWQNWVRPAAGLAAVLAIALTLFWTAGVQTPVASAATLDLSRLHADLVSGRVAVPVVTTFDDANATIAEQFRNGPALPAVLEGARVQSCCLTDVQADLKAIAVMRIDDAIDPVTLVVAEAPDFAHEMGTVIKIDGRTFFGHELNGIPMMMSRSGDRWLCVMGNRTMEDLAHLAANVRFGAL